MDCFHGSLLLVVMLSSMNAIAVTGADNTKHAIRPISVKNAPSSRTPVQSTVTTLPPVNAPVVKGQVLSPIMAANAKEYALLKKNLGLAEEDLSRIDVLEMVVLAYSKMFDGLDARTVDLANRTQELVSEVSALRTDTDRLQSQVIG